MQKRTWLWALLAALLSLFLLFPYAVMVFTAFKPDDQVYQLPVRILPLTWRWQNFVEVWTYAPLARYMTNTALIASGATLISLACAIPSAYVLSRYRLRIKGLYMYVILVTQMFSPIVLLVGIYREIAALGLIDTLFSLMLVNAAFSQAFAVWMLMSFFSTIPEEVEQAAWVDGASRWQGIWRVVLPISGPGLVTVLIFIFIMAWNEFPIALTLIASPDNTTLSLGLYTFLGRYDIKWQYLCAASLYATVPVVALFLAVERFLLSGLTSGAIK